MEIRQIITLTTGPTEVLNGESVLNTGETEISHEHFKFHTSDGCLHLELTFHCSGINLSLFWSYCEDMFRNHVFQ